MEHLIPGQKDEKQIEPKSSLSLVCRPPLLRPPRHRFGPGKSFLTLCHSQPRRPARVKAVAHRGRRSPARQRWCSNCAAPSFNFSVVAKIGTVSILSCNHEGPLNTRAYSYQKSQMEARQSPLAHLSCLEAHATPRHESGDRVPCNPPSTRQHPLTPVTAPGSPAVPCSEYTKRKNKKGRKDRECQERW